MTAAHDTVFLIDVDNTLLDNDRVVADLGAHLEQQFGADVARRYWAEFETLWEELGYADYLGAAQRLRRATVEDTRLLWLAGFLLDYPFAERLYPGALEVLAHLRRAGQTVILSDGDAVYQPRKLKRSGLFDAADGHVLIYVNKERMAADLRLQYPARRYVMIDDKLRLLSAMQAAPPGPLTTLFVRQGRYALDTQALKGLTPAQIQIERIADLLQITPAALRGEA
jgi:FMN phosphatase YigB (HAD superfamily)